MGNKLVSIAMATYNGERYLRQQLESIYNQTYKNIEVVVCDDCSTDQTIQILSEFSSRYNLQYVRNHKNLGFVKNFERAITLCKGNYIALADQDDIWLPYKIEILLKEIHIFSLICSDAILINSQGEKIADSFRQYQHIPVNDGKQLKNLIYNNFVTGCTTLFRRELAKAALPIPAGFGYHDWWLAIAATKEDGIKYVDQQLVMYRQHDSNDTGAQQSEALINKILRYISNKPSLTGNKRVKYYSMIIRSLELLLHSKIELSTEEIKFVQDAIHLYTDKLNTSIHYKAFRITLKYQNYIFPDYNFINRQVASIGWLVN